jgi:hypothetical protein
MLPCHGRQRTRMEWRVGRHRESAEHRLASIATQPSCTNAHEVGVAVLKAHAANHLSATALKMLTKQLQDGTSPAVVQAMLVMAECGVPCHAILPGNPFEAVPVLQHTPSPRELFTEYVLPGRPVVLRGAVATAWPPMRHFWDAAYLRTHCGHRSVPVKSLAIHDADGRPVFMSDPGQRLPLGEFLDAVDAAEGCGARCPYYLGKVALRHALPELADALEAASTAACAPPQLFASCFGPLVPEGVFTYFGCDRNVTATHLDNSENLLLCLRGTKRLWLYPPSDVRYLYPAAERARITRADAPPFRRLDELPPGLRSQFGKIAHASPVEVHLQAGDLLYLPACWWHCVEGSRERNMILNWWFGLHPMKAAQEAGGPAPKWVDWVERWPNPLPTKC